MKKRILGASSQRGLTLVEVMIAITLSLLVLAAVINVFLSSRQTYRAADSTSRLQEAGRFAIEKLTDGIRMAGHVGCLDPDDAGDRVEDISGQGLVFPGSGLGGTDGDTDSLSVQFAAQSFAQLAVTQVGTSDDLVFTTKPDVAKDGFAIIADCGHASIIKVADVDDKTVSYDGDVNRVYPAGSRLMKMAGVVFTVADTGRTDAGSPVYALYENGDELVEGVENLQIQYGVRDTATNTIRYVDWTGGLNPKDIVSMRVAVLVSSPGVYRDTVDNEAYTLLGTTVNAAGPSVTGPTHPADKRLRRVFSTTVTLRNVGGI